MKPLMIMQIEHAISKIIKYEVKKQATTDGVTLTPSNHLNDGGTVTVCRT